MSQQVLIYDPTNPLFSNYWRVYQHLLEELLCKESKKSTMFFFNSSVGLFQTVQTEEHQSFLKYWKPFSECGELVAGIIGDGETMFRDKVFYTLQITFKSFIAIDTFLLVYYGMYVEGTVFFFHKRTCRDFALRYLNGRKARGLGKRHGANKAVKK